MFCILVQVVRLPEPRCREGSGDSYQLRPSIQDCEEAAQPFYLAALRQQPDFFGQDLPSLLPSPPSFPPPSGVNINMMPFLVGQTFEDCQLPESVRPYWSMVEACVRPELERAGHHLWPRDEVPSELGKVWYLTVQEGWVEGGASQRRAGLHVDSPGRVNIANREEEEGGMEGRGVSQLFEGHRYGGFFTPGGLSSCYCSSSLLLFPSSSILHLWLSSFTWPGGGGGVPTL